MQAYAPIFLRHLNLKKKNPGNGILKYYIQLMVIQIILLRMVLIQRESRQPYLRCGYLNQYS